MPTALRSDRQRIAKLEKIMWILAFNQAIFYASLCILYVMK